MSKGQQLQTGETFVGITLSISCLTVVYIAFFFAIYQRLLYERFEPRSHFKSRLSLIVWVNVVLNRTVVVDSD